METRKNAWARFGLPALVFVWSAAWILSRYSPDLPPGNDSCFYLVNAKGFATGNAYRDLASANPEAGILLGPSFFPWLLSLYWRLPHPNLALLKGLVACLMALGPALAFLWLRRWIPTPLAMVVTLAFGASSMFILQGNSIMTECIFVPMLYGAVWLTEKTTRLPGSPRPPGEPARWDVSHATQAVIAILLWAALARTRVVGWAFLAAFMALALGDRRYIRVTAAAFLAAGWVGLERFLARGVSVGHYTDNVFSRTYPIKVDFWLGFKALAANIGSNLFDFAAAICGHILFPFFYELGAMNRSKRLACLIVFLWTAWGAWLVWKTRPPWRPWLLAIGVASIPTFVIFEPHDSFRYHMPFFPFLCLFFLAPFQWLAEGVKVGARKRLPFAAAVFLLMAQAGGALRHDFASDFMDYPGDFSAMHDSLSAHPVRPDVCFSPDPYYTWLRTGCPSFPDVGQRVVADFQRFAEGKEAWILCGPGNQYMCDRWQSQGLVFSDQPLGRSGTFTLHRIDRWPRESDFPASAGGN